MRKRLARLCCKIVNSIEVIVPFLQSSAALSCMEFAWRQTRERKQHTPDFFLLLAENVQHIGAKCKCIIWARVEFVLKKLRCALVLCGSSIHLPKSIPHFHFFCLVRFLSAYWFSSRIYFVQTNGYNSLRKNKMNDWTNRIYFNCFSYLWHMLAPLPRWALSQSHWF